MHQPLRKQWVFRVTLACDLRPQIFFLQHIIGFVDPSADPSNPGWPLRNLLTYLRTLYPSTTSTVHILRWRDSEIAPSNAAWKSQIGTLYLATTESTTADPQSRRSAVGWEKNPQGKLGPRLADLAPMMDPTRLAAQAVDLNLKLMRWRILPSLELDKISSTRCLLLGAGTLGCYVARALMVCTLYLFSFIYLTSSTGMGSANDHLR